MNPEASAATPSDGSDSDCGAQAAIDSASYADRSTSSEPSPLEPLRVSYHQHYFALGAHYNSVVKALVEG